MSYTQVLEKELAIPYFIGMGMMETNSVDKKGCLRHLLCQKRSLENLHCGTLEGQINSTPHGNIHLS